MSSERRSNAGTPAAVRKARRRHGSWRRRGRAAALALAILAAMWLAGRGAGLFGGGAVPSDEGRTEHGARAENPTRGSGPGGGEGAVGGDEAGSGADSDVGTGSGAGDAVAGAVRQPGRGTAATGPSEADPQPSARTSEGNGASPPEPSTEPAAVPAAEISADAAGDTAAPTVSDDRFDGISVLIRRHLEAGRIEPAAAALARLQRMSLRQDQRERLLLLTSRLVEHRQAAEQAVVALLRDGHVLRAERAVRTLSGGEPWRGEGVAAAVPTLAFADDWHARPDEASTATPAALPLERSRTVRVWWRDELRQGEVASQRGDRVTVRLRSETGQSFPTVAASECEPVRASAAECASMGFCALQAAAPLLARLWLARAAMVAEADGEPLPEVALRLQAALR